MMIPGGQTEMLRDLRLIEDVQSSEFDVFRAEVKPGEILEPGGSALAYFMSYADQAGENIYVPSTDEETIYDLATVLARNCVMEGEMVPIYFDTIKEKYVILGSWGLIRPARMDEDIFLGDSGQATVFHNGAATTFQPTVHVEWGIKMAAQNGVGYIQYFPERERWVVLPMSHPIHGKLLSQLTTQNSTTGVAGTGTVQVKAQGTGHVFANDGGTQTIYQWAENTEIDGGIGVIYDSLSHRFINADCPPEGEDDFVGPTL